MTSAPMKRALQLAKRGLGKTSPNPVVGAVITDPEGHIIAEGYHKKAGGPHAEIVALKKAGFAARGNTLYVTLEPCNHTGKTPPCTQAIIGAGISRVVVAMADPNPHVQGGGIDRLRHAGIPVDVGDGHDEAWQLNLPFVTWSRQHRPYITLKAAMTLDGKIASFTGESKYLTSAAALAHAHDLRRVNDAILVGSGTVLQDDPRLTYRGRARGRQPVRVVLDTRGRVTAAAQVFQTDRDVPTLVFTAESTDVDWERHIFSAGGEVVRVPTDDGGHVSIPDVLSHLADRHILSLLVEGGPTVHAAFVSRGLADRWISYLAPKILGGQAAPSAVAGEGFSLQNAPLLHIERVLKRGPDVIIEAQFH